jgi:hypothetical protein
MNYKILIFIFFIFSCKNTQNTEGGKNVVASDSVGNKIEIDTSVQATVTTKTDKPVQNFTLVPKQQVGLITANMTEADLKKAYGDANVGRVDRGDVQTVIYPNSENELEISWKKGQDFKKLQVAIIRKGNWKTAEGISIGTTTEDLNRINGKKIELYQLEENFAIVRWKEGSVNPKLKVMVDTETQKVVEMQIDF